MSGFLSFIRLRYFPFKNRKISLIFLISFVLLNVFLFLYLFSNSAAEIITLEEIPNKLVIVPRTNLKIQSDEFCEIMPSFKDTDVPYLNLTISDSYLKELPNKLNIKEGGVWNPSDCIAVHNVAIVVPYRDRISQLNVFLSYIHPFLQMQKISYRIFIVEQTFKRPFNRGKLFNVGYAEAEKISSFQCYIFQDVDLIPQNLYNVYGCTQLPRHMSSYIDVFDYKLPYDSLFGGAVAILNEQFRSVNGFSNIFFGWGGEDDDLYKRVTLNGTRICRYEYPVSSYTMLTHKKETPSEDRYFYLATSENRMKDDGLNSLKYAVKSVDKFPLYTRIFVDL